MKIIVRKSTDVKDVQKLIAEKAYALFLDRQAQGVPGDKDSDWIRAEMEIKNAQSNQNKGFRKVS